MFILNRTQFEAYATHHYILLCGHGARVRRSVAPSILLESKSEVGGGAIFLCARDVTVNGFIDASGVVGVQ